MNLLNSIFVRRKNKYIINSSYLNTIPPNEIPSETKQLVSTACKNLETSFGYSLSNRFVAQLLLLPSDSIKEIYNELYAILNHINPSKVPTPMYKNFPKQVMELSEAEIYTNAVMHYMGDLIGVRIMPEYPEEERPPLIENTNIKIIDIGSYDEFYEMFYNLMQASSSISETDRNDLFYILQHHLDDYLNYYQLPQSFNHKEVMAYVITTLINKNVVTKNYVLLHIDNITDILRIVEGINNNGGDISLSEKTKYKLNRRKRKFIISLIDELIRRGKSSVDDAAEDMYRHKNRWIKLGEVIHPGEFKEKFPYCNEIFHIIRNEKIDTFEAQIDRYLNQNKVLELVDNLLIQRPGVFARKILHLLRFKNNNYIVDKFVDVAHKVSTRVLFQLYGEARALYLSQLDYFPKDYRIFVPKGNMAKAFVKCDDRSSIPPNILNNLLQSIEEVLTHKFSKLEPLGRTYVDENLFKYAIPMTQRSASSGIKTIPRFSRFKIDKNFVRTFIYWKNNNKQVDVDLSVCFVDENLELVDYVAYTNIRSKVLNAVHSGDITSAPNGASEFIDVDLNEAYKKGVRYIVPSIFNFTGDFFKDTPMSSFGWMEREDVNSGEIYEPTTVSNRINLATESSVSTPLIIDVENSEIIWCDFMIHPSPGSFKSGRGFNAYQHRAAAYGINPSGINIENNLNQIKAIILGAINSQNKPDLYTLLYLHAESRGEFVDDPEEADVIFSETNETQYAIDEILGNYLID